MALPQQAMLYADRQLLPVLVRVDFIASVLQILLEAEEEYARCANVLLESTYASLLNRNLHHALQTKAVAKTAGLLKPPSPVEPAQDVKNGKEGDDGRVPTLPSAPRPSLGSASTPPPPKSPVAAADAFSFGGEDSDSDGGDGGAASTDNPFDSW